LIPIRANIAVLDSDMAYVDTGAGDPVISDQPDRRIFSATSSLMSVLGRFRAGFDRRLGKNPSGSYRFVDHARYLNAGLTLGLSKCDVSASRLGIR
jgi:haloalkane dehalogenase